MGMGLSIETVAIEWPTEEVPTRCLQCGSRLLLTRYDRSYGPDRPPPPDVLALESEQLCPVCGEPACQESQSNNKSGNNQKLDFFSLFKK